MFKRIGKLDSFRALLKRSGMRHQSNMTDIFINGKPVKVPSYFTILQALRQEGVVVPTFCYHERLSVVANCRMCIVQIEGMMKPQTACSINVGKGMKIRTNSPAVMQAHESVLEFILLNHPLDCPICDQGGECDLQDLTLRHGNDRSRFTDIHFSGKHSVEIKELGPLIRAEMVRCIHCTRCIRFGSEIAGLDILGTAGRGNGMLIGTYVSKPFLSEVSGNIIDLCPVGALTSKPYMFVARPWELSRKDSIDVTDATGTNISLNVRFDKVVRVLPRENDEVNQEWVSDKGRFAIDSLRMQRLVTPMLRDANLCLCTTEWHEALSLVSQLICDVDKSKIVAVAGPYTNVETLVTTKDLLNVMCSEHCYIDRELCIPTGTDIRAAFSLNVNMKDIPKADCIVLIGTNPRFEAPILNVWIRQAYRTNDCDIYVIGPECEYNYCVNYLGDSFANISKVGDVLKNYENPLIFVGIDQIAEEQGAAMITQLAKMTVGKLKPDWGIINFVTKEASFAGALEAGWKPGAASFIKKNCPSLVISLGADNLFKDWQPSCPVVYIGFQGDLGAQCASIILPGSAYTEAGGLFMNMEGRSQVALPAVTPPGKARYDWKIIRALAEYCGVCLFYCDQTSLQCRMSQVSPNFTFIGKYQQKELMDMVGMDMKAKPGSGPLKVAVQKLKDYYCTDAYTYNSSAMLKARQVAYEFESSDYAKN